MNETNGTGLPRGFAPTSPAKARSRRAARSLSVWCMRCHCALIRPGQQRQLRPTPASIGTGLRTASQHGRQHDVLPCLPPGAGVASYVAPQRVPRVHDQPRARYARPGTLSLPAYELAPLWHSQETSACSKGASTCVCVRISQSARSSGNAEGCRCLCRTLPYASARVFTREGVVRDDGGDKSQNRKKKKKNGQLSTRTRDPLRRVALRIETPESSNKRGGRGGAAAKKMWTCISA